MSRTRNSIINVMVAMSGQGVALIVSFIARIFFINILGADYLGINGLFTNILTMLSLVELGIGPAIIFSLYKPLAEKDFEKIKLLMQLYKKSYTIIGIAVGLLGLLVTPFLPYIIKEMPDVPNLNLIFILFVINSAISYFYAYKRNLIIADQYRYVDTIYKYIFYVILNILQVLFLFFTGSYILFLILQIASSLLENIAVAKQADKMYPFLKDKGYGKLDGETVKIIKRNTGAMIFHKVGGIVISATDNIVISAKVGIIWVGLYSNYLLIITALNSIIGQLFSSVTASIGNLGATESKEKSFFVFNNIQFANFWIYGFSSICLYWLSNPFINLWIGKEYLMTMDIVAILVINFYVQGMRKSVLTFRDALGLYWNDRYKPLFEVTINIVASIILASKLGIVGVFIGTLISTITTCFWIEPYVVYKKGFESPLGSYFFKYAIYTIAVIVAGFLTGICVKVIAGSTILSVVAKMMICLMVPNIVFLILFYRTKEFDYLWSIMKSIILKRINKNGL